MIKLIYKCNGHVMHFSEIKVWWVLQKFCITTNPFSTKNQQTDLKPKNFILRVKTYFSIESPYLVRHFPYRSMSILMPANLLLPDLSLVLVHSTLNPCTYQFMVDFMITFCIPFTTHILRRTSLPETFFTVKNHKTFHSPSLGTTASVAAIVIFLITV